MEQERAKQAALDAALKQIDKHFGKGSAPLPRPETMTEAVARELCRQRLLVDEREVPPDALARLVDAHWRGFIQRAQDVFGVMLTPTEEMLDDVEGWQPKDQYQDLETERERIEFIWQTMLTAAEYELDEHTLAQKASLAEADRKWREAGCPTEGDPPF
jgi:hypothetical protein